MKIKSLLIAATAALAVAGTPALAQDIDTSGAYVDGIGRFGPTWTSTYGQTFTVGSENALDSFTLYLGGMLGRSQAINFQAYVYAWNGARAVGDAIFTSSLQTFTGTRGNAVQAFSFDTGGIDLVSGNQYVAFLSTAGIANRSESGVWMPTAGAFGSDAYSGGSFVYANIRNFASLTARDWDYAGSYGAFGDVQFKADFSAGATSGVPEPAAWAMLIGGFGLAGGAVRRRRDRLARAFA